MSMMCVCMNEACLTNDERNGLSEQPSKRR